MEIHLLHGVVDTWLANASSYRNYVSAESLERHLIEHAGSYGPWTGGLVEHDILTVDDATAGGAAACALARRHGLEVIFFVNPMQVATGAPYYFSLLDAILDATKTGPVTHQGQVFDLSIDAERQAYRRALKSRLMNLPSEKALAETCATGELLGVNDVCLPAHVKPVTIDELRELVSIGVRVENHGWSHVNVGSFTEETAFQHHVGNGQTWLRDELNVESKLYATPFGMTDLEPGWRNWLEGDYFLADPRRQQGRIAANGWNRKDIGPLLQQAR